MVLICELFQISLHVGQLKSYGISTSFVHVKMIMMFITNVQYLAETFLNNICRGKCQ